MFVLVVCMRPMVCLYGRGEIFFELGWRREFHNVGAATDLPTTAFSVLLWHHCRNSLEDFLASPNAAGWCDHMETWSLE